MATETTLLPPRYQDPEPIGRGAMGEIYRATDSALGRKVAVKLLAERYADDLAVRGRFTREAHAAARLSGAANVVTIFDVGEWRQRPYFVMAYLPGGSLADMLEREGAQPPARSLAWLEQAARALDEAHASGVVHRDVKPANLLLDGAGNVHVADFGIASAAGTDSLTQTGTVLGTAGYLAPEQARGERTTAASDRYVLAVVAWELLTGERPFASDSIAAEATAHVQRPVPSICRVRPELPCELDPVFERALAKDPAARHGSCAELVAELRGALAEAAGRTQVVAAPPPARTRMPRRRPWLWPVVAVLALAAIAGGALAAALGGGDSSPATSPPVVKTVTRGVTVQETVTAQAPPSATTASTPSSTDPHALNDQAWALMQRGDFADALPLLQQAVQGLQGAGPGDVYEGFANYNLGIALIQLGRCADAIPSLQRAKELEPGRHEVHDALKIAERC